MARKQNDDLLIEDELAAAFLNDDELTQQEPAPAAPAADDNAWEEPVNLTAVNSVGFEGGPMLFEDETTGTVQLYLAAAPYPGGTQAVADLYVSTLGPDGFQTPVPVTELNAACCHDGKPFVRRDGLEIFFEGMLVAVAVLVTWFAIFSVMKLYQGQR